MTAKSQLPLRNMMDYQDMGACAFVNVREIRNQGAHVTRRVFITPGEHARHGVDKD